MGDWMIVSLVCLCLLAGLLPFFLIIAMLSRIRHTLSRLEKSVSSLRQPEQVRVRDHCDNQ